MATRKKSGSNKSSTTRKKESMTDYVKDIAEFEKFLLCVLNEGFSRCRDSEEFKTYLKACELEKDFDLSEDLVEDLSWAKDFFLSPDYGYIDQYDLVRPIGNLTKPYSDRLRRNKISDVGHILGGLMECYLEQRGISVDAPELYTLMVELDGKYPDIGEGFI